MEGFTVTLALVDAIPVLCYAISMILIGLRFPQPLFLAGAVVSTFAGCCKVLWKLLLGIRKKDVRWLNRPFVPMQATGFLMMLVSFVIGFHRISWTAVLGAVTQLPGAAFFLLWAVLMCVMAWYRKHRFDNTAKTNWTAQIINSIAQLSLLAGVVLAAAG